MATGMAKGCHKTHGNNCVTCNVLTETKYFSSFSTKLVYEIHQSLTCTSPYVIYVVNCLKPDCMKQYVGETENTLTKRHYGHRSEIQSRATPFGQHFSMHPNYELIAIEQVPDNGILEERKKFWINTLGACSINVKYCR